MKILKSAGFWIFIASLTLVITAFFLFPLLGVKAWLPRILGSLVPAVLGLLVFLVVKVLRLKSALAGQKKAPKANPFEAKLQKPWHEPLLQETRAGLEILRASARGKTTVGQDPLDLFRFYLVAGTTASGKSTLLEHSGVHFPRKHPTDSDRARQTQHFARWLFSNDGIFLETPARYLSGDGEEELTEWLGLLEKEGKTLPLDGILLTLRMGELLQGEENTAALAQALRDRISHIMGALKLELPLYLVFTQADLIPGFSEYFQYLKDSEAQQILGATFAVSGNLGPVRDRFEREYRKLYESLQARLPYRLGQCQTPQERQKVFSFPNEFGAAQERLAGFVDLLMKDSLRRERAQLRGFFFTSIQATASSEEAVAFDTPQAMHPLDVRGKFQAPGTARPAPAGGGIRSLFSRLIFAGVLKTDKSLARIPGYRLGSMSRRALLTAAGLTALAVLILAYGGIGYLRSQQRLNDFKTAAEAAASLTFRDPLAFPRDFETFTGLLLAMEDLRESDSWLIPPGFAHTGEALELGKRLHASLLRSGFLNDYIRNATAGLEMGARYFNPGDHGTLRESLRLYLLLTTEGAPRARDTEPEELAGLLLPFLAQDVLNRYGPEFLPHGFETAFEPHVLAWSRRYTAGKEPPLAKTQPAIVEEARNALLGSPSIEGLYSSIVVSEDPSLDLSLNSMGVPPDALLKTSTKVRGFYTRAAFTAGALDKLAEGAEQPHRKDWVLGDRVAALPPEMQDKNQLSRALEERYFEEYEQEWLKLLSSLTVRVPSEPGQAAGQLSGYASSTQGLTAVLTRMQTEVDLLTAPTQEQDLAKEKLLKGKLKKFTKLLDLAAEKRDARKKALKARFQFLDELVGPKGSGSGVLAEYFSALRGVAEMLNGIALSADGNAEILEAAKVLFQGKSENPLNRAWAEANKIRIRYDALTWLPPLLEGPVREVAALLAEASRQLEAEYQTKVYLQYQRTLQGRYPIKRNVSQEAGQDELKSFFNPETGVFTAFLKNKLSPFVKSGDGGFVPKTWNGLRVNFRNESLRAIERARLVGNRIFTDGPSNAPRLYNLNLTLSESKNSREVRFRLGDDVIPVKKGEGQLRQTLRWPGESSYKGAEVVLVEVDGGTQSRRADGTWGLMKLLDGARALNLRPGGFSAKWRFTVAGKYDVDVSLEAMIPERENPFSTPDFYQFDLPPSLVESQAGGDGSGP